MFRNYFKTIVRNFLRYRWYAGLNLIGLTVGFTAFILISIYVYHQTHYEQFHSKADRIFRPTWYNNVGKDFTVQWARIPFDFINELPDFFPEIEAQIRLQNQDKKYKNRATEIHTSKCICH